MTYYNYRRLTALAFFVLLICGSERVWAQQSKHCSIISVLLNDSEACAIFKFDRVKEVPIRFIDVRKILATCNLGSIYNRNVEIVSDTTLKKEISVSNIIIYGVERKGNRYIMEIAQKFTGAYGTIEFKRRQKKFYISKRAVGYF